MGDYMELAAKVCGIDLDGIDDVWDTTDRIDEALAERWDIDLANLRRRVSVAQATGA